MNVSGSEIPSLDWKSQRGLSQDFIIRSRALKSNVNDILIGSVFAIDRSIQAASTTERPLSCVMLDLPTPIAFRILTMSAKISKFDLSDRGIEMEPHITVRYGLHSQSAPEVLGSIKESKPPRVMLGSSSIFETDEFDVVKLNVASSDLHSLHDKLGQLPHTDKHVEYQPHVTLAYVKPGSGKKYQNALNDLKGEIVILDSLIFSDGEKSKTKVKIQY